MTEQVPPYAPKRTPVVVPVRPNYHTTYLRRPSLKMLVIDHAIDGPFRPRPEITIAYTVDAANNTVFGAIAYFNPQDKSFSKKEGRKMAFERLDALLADHSLATDESRFYFKLTAQDLNAPFMNHIDVKLLRSSPTHAALVKALTETNVTELLNGYVWRKVVQKALEMVDRPRNGFKLDVETAEALMLQTETAAAAGSIPTVKVDEAHASNTEIV